MSAGWRYSVQNLAFSYDDDREILHGIDMAFKSGSFTAVVGESGCGKSTTAGIIMGHMKIIREM